MGFGTLWMTYERRGDFRRLVDDMAKKHFPPSEVKWEKVKRRTYPISKPLSTSSLRETG
jgi:hypothetical protein